MLLLATSPGPRGAKSVLESAKKAYGYSNKNVVAHYSLPSFHENFAQKEGIIDKPLRDELDQKLNLLKTTMDNFS